MVSVRLVKKHKTAGLVPNGLAVTTEAGRKVNAPVWGAGLLAREGLC